MKKVLTSVLLACAFITNANAQRTPEHPLDIKDATTDLADYFDSWQVGTPPPGVSTIDDQFYIGRQRPLKRIENSQYQENATADPNRKFVMWTPLDDPTTKWRALPRYIFEGDNFSMWSYIDIHGNWTAPWFRATAGITDAAHKNGVNVGTNWSIPWNTYVTAFNSNGKKFQKLIEKDLSGNYKNAEKLVKLMKYYGVNGLGVNSEFNSNQSFITQIMDFFKKCHEIGDQMDWDFDVYWYDGTDDSGTISFDQGLDAHNDKVFGSTDMLLPTITGAKEC